MVYIPNFHCALVLRIFTPHSKCRVSFVGQYIWICTSYRNVPGIEAEVLRLKLSQGLMCGHCIYMFEIYLVWIKSIVYFCQQCYIL